MQIPRPGDTKFDVLKAVNDHCRAHPKGPTVEELRVWLDLGTRSAVQFHIDDLVDMGLLTRLPRKTRGLRPTPKGQKLVELFGALDTHGEPGEPVSPVVAFDNGAAES